MSPQAKNFMQNIGSIITVLGLLVGIVSAFAIQSEKVKQLEQSTCEIKTNVQTTEKYNSDEHKLILEKLGEIQGILKDPRRGR